MGTGQFMRCEWCGIAFERQLARGARPRFCVEHKRKSLRIGKPSSNEEVKLTPTQRRQLGISDAQVRVVWAPFDAAAPFAGAIRRNQEEIAAAFAMSGAYESARRMGEQIAAQVREQFSPIARQMAANQESILRAFDFSVLDEAASAMLASIRQQVVTGNGDWLQNLSQVDDSWISNMGGLTASSVDEFNEMIAMTVGESGVVDANGVEKGEEDLLLAAGEVGLLAQVVITCAMAVATLPDGQLINAYRWTRDYVVANPNVQMALFPFSVLGAAMLIRGLMTDD